MNETSPKSLDFNNAWVFWKVYFWAGSLFIYQNGLESHKAVGVTSENIHYFDFCVSWLYTFNPLSLSLNWVTTLVATIYRNMETRQSCKTTYIMRLKGSERRPFFIFRLNIVLHDSYQVDEMEWKQTVPGDYVKNFSRLLFSVLETSILS